MMIFSFIQKFSFRKVLPLPTSISSNTFKMIYSRHQIPREHRSNCTASVKYARPFCQFVLPIPRADHILHTWIESTLCEPDEKSQHIYLSGSVATRQAHFQNCPNNLDLRWTWNLRSLGSTYLASWNPY
jgi:hypothetical protein